MSSSLNKVFLCGNLGADPEVRDVSGVSVATFNMATSTGGYKKQDGTEVPEKTQWHRIIAWRGQANLCKFLKKGDRVSVFGSIEYREYEKDGLKHNVTEIIAEELIPSSKPTTGGSRDIPLPEPPMEDGAPF